MTKDEDLRLALDALERIKWMAAQATDALDIADIREAAWSALAAISALSAPAAQPALRPEIEELRDDFEAARYVGLSRPRFSTGECAALFAEIDRLRALAGTRQPAAQPVPVVQPLTDAAAALLATRIVGGYAVSLVTAVRIIRETEREHGIGGANG